MGKSQYNGNGNSMNAGNALPLALRDWQYRMVREQFPHQVTA